MQKSFRCAECSTIVVIPKCVKTVSCRRCGDVSFVSDGVVRRVYPSLHMRPIDHALPSPDYPPSIWMLTWTRPVLQGLYECRFRHTEPHVIPLRWNGSGFVAPLTGERVCMSRFLSWRGVLA